MNYSKWLVRSGCTLECANCGHRIPMKMHYIFCPKCGSEMNTEEYERELLNKLGNVRAMRAAKLEGCNLTDEEEEG